MVQEKMNIHRALSELKVLDSRVKKAIAGTDFVVCNKHSNTKIGGMPIGEFCDQVKAGYKSATDLIARRAAIKRAVVLSNAVTKVTIAGVEYTVAEAIEMKNHGIELKKELVGRLRMCYLDAKINAQTANSDVLERRADEYIKSLYGSTDMKNASEDVKRTREDFITAQTTELVDPIGASKEIEKLDAEISAFMVEVDSALSVSNAMTEIEVSY